MATTQAPADHPLIVAWDQANADPGSRAALQEWGVRLLDFGKFNPKLVSDDFDDGAGAHFDVSLLTDEAAAALGELGVEEAVYSMPFGECMDVLRRVIARETSGERPA